MNTVSAMLVMQNEYLKFLYMQILQKYLYKKEETSDFFYL